MTSIYGLYDREGQLRYIGKAVDPHKRFQGHMREAALGRRKTPLYVWLRKHGWPEMRVLVADTSDWRAGERRLIAEHRAIGTRLLNVADGGDEPYCPVEVRRENGRKRLAEYGWGTKRDMATYTRRDLIVDTYEWCLRFALKSNLVGSTYKMMIKMAERNLASPSEYPMWDKYGRIDLDAARTALDLYRSNRDRNLPSRRGDREHQGCAQIA